MRSGLFFLGSLALVACTDHAPAPVGSALDAPARILASTPTASSTAFVTIPGSDGVVKMLAPIRQLKLGVHTGATPAIDMLEMRIGDIDISSTTLPPSGLSLRDVTLSIPQSLAVQIDHAQSTAVEMHATTALRMNWSKVVGPDGETEALEPVPSEPVEVSVQVLMENGVPTTIISAGTAIYVESRASVDAL